MRKLLKLKKDTSIVFASEITKFLDPDYIYIPIKKNYQVLVKNAEVISKGQIILENNLNKVLSPISGTIKGIELKNIDGIMDNALVVQNNFKEQEKKYNKRSTIKYEKDYIISKLYEFYFKYIASILESTKITNLVISGIDDEPYILNNAYIINKYNKEILEITDILAKTFGIFNSFIAMKSNDTKNIETYLSTIGTYPNISLSLVDDKYLLGKPFFLLEYLQLKEADTLVIDAKTIYEIYNAIKYNRFMHETFITISGSAINKSMVIEVKVGSLLSDIIKKNIKIQNQDNLYILNGLMTGQECDPNNTIVTKSTLGLIIIPKKDIQEDECIKCGLCYKVCPVKVNPKKVLDTKKTSKNCIDCGLCSYICPSHINLRKVLKGEHE